MIHVRNASLSVLALALLLASSTGCSKDDNGPTGPPADTTAPTVSSTNPLNGATGVAVITATFDEPMTASTITTANFMVMGPGATSVAGSVAYDAASQTARFTPTSPLVASTSYTATVTSGVKDTAGNPMSSSRVWTFTSSAASATLLAPALGSASAFAVLAGSTVISTGATELTGDLGVSPGSAVVGFPPGTFTGTQHAGDAASASGMSALDLAYTDAAGRVLAPVIIAGNLGGLTLPPGLYRSTSSLAISSGDLTLDAQGDPNAVFLFQIASTLTTTSGRSVLLTGGARASNVYWQVGSSASLGTTSVFKGTILADQSITLNTGSSISGRALARVGAVTLAGSAVVMPTP